jgi:hypothetical protein
MNNANRCFLSRGHLRNAVFCPLCGSSLYSWECYGSNLPLAEESRRKRAVASTGLVKW